MGEPVENKWWFEDKRVLLVEDNDLVHDLVRTIMERVGVDIDICINGAEAVEFVQNKVYDIVLMDIQMPIMDGLEATQAIRQLGGSMLNLPIIAMSANSHSEDIEMGRKAGMNAHLGKPIDKELLYSTISEFLGKNTKDEISESADGEIISADFPTLAHIDTKDGLQRVVGNTRVYRTMLINFRQKYLTAVDEISSFLQSQDYQQAVRLSHNIKGNAGNLGARTLYQYAAKMELACKKQQADVAKELLPELEAELSLVIRDIKSVAEDTGQMPKARIKFDPEIWSSKCRGFLRLLDTDFGAATDALRDLILASGDNYREEMSLLEKHMNDFDVDSARMVVENIQNNSDKT